MAAMLAKGVVSATGQIKQDASPTPCGWSGTFWGLDRATLGRRLWFDWNRRMVPNLFSRSFALLWSQ